jgi:TraM recognition site of TraD and TraG/Helicase HerA, central domain
MNPLLPPTEPLSETIPWHTLKLEVEQLFSHLVVFGRPGSGKSRNCVRPLVRELISLHAPHPTMKAGMLLIDPKGWELREWVTEALKQVGREDDLIVVSPTEATYNPLADTDHSTMTPAQIAQQLIAATSVLGGDATQRTKNSDRFWAQAELEMLGCLVAMARHSLLASGVPRPLSFEHLIRLRPLLSRSDSEIAEFAAGIALEIGEPVGTSLIEFAKLPQTTRSCIVSSVGTTLSAFAQAPLSQVLIPEAGRPQLDLATIIADGKIVLLDVAHADNAADLLPAAIWLKTAFAKLVLSRRRGAGRINQVRPVFAIFEEFQRVMTPQADSGACEGNLLDMSRGSRCGVILCTQSVSSLLATAGVHLTDKLISLAGTHVFYGNTDHATAALASRSLGQRTLWQEHRSISSPPLPPPLLFPRPNGCPKAAESKVLVPSVEPVLPPEKLALLPQGRFWTRLANGSVHEIQADVSAP